jgi:hypothetical protein
LLFPIVEIHISRLEENLKQIILCAVNKASRKENKNKNAEEFEYGTEQ